MSTGTASRGLALQCSSYLSQSLRMGEERMRFWGCYHVTYITYTPSYITIHYYNYDVIQYWCNASKRYTKKPEEVRHACTNHYKFSALMSLLSRDNIQAKCTELVVIRARMSDLFCQEAPIFWLRPAVSGISLDSRCFSFTYDLELRLFRD